MRPCAFIELKPGKAVTAEDILEWWRTRLARYKCPRHVIVAEIPKTSTGKIQKFKLREMSRSSDNGGRMGSPPSAPHSERWQLHV